VTAGDAKLSELTPNLQTGYISYRKKGLCLHEVALWGETILNSASMWSPIDKSSLPTPEERKKAKEVIDLLQKDLENAMESLVRAQLRVDILRKDVEERKAWVAPVRRLTFDALSVVFDWCADIEWDSAVRIAAVCRTWRSIVLDTPRAWSFADLSSEISDKEIKMFFERSRERPLHVHLRGPWLFDLTSVAHRVQSLALDSISPYLKPRVFPNLQRLSISEDSGTSITDVNTRFPNLLQLVTAKTKLYHRTGSVDTIISFPQLESWSLRTSRSLAWVDGLRSCQNTLVSLTIHGHSYGIPGEHPPILLPVLNFLKLKTGHVSSRGQFNLKTPRLESYEEETDPFEAPLHPDVDSVMLMRFIVKGLPNLYVLMYPGLKRV